MVYVTSTDGNVYAFHLPGGIAGINRPNPGNCTRPTPHGR
jgi:hypothetical protein